MEELGIHEIATFDNHFENKEGILQFIEVLIHL